jgi:hypothetical protein
MLKPEGLNLDSPLEGDRHPGIWPQCSESLGKSFLRKLQDHASPQ